MGPLRFRELLFHLLQVRRVERAAKLAQGAPGLTQLERATELRPDGRPAALMSVGARTQGVLHLALENPAQVFLGPHGVAFE